MPADSPDLSDLFHSVSHGLRRTWTEDLAPLGISPHQWRALHTVAAHSDGVPPRQRDVAAALRIAPRSAAEVIAQLEASGWITREPDPSDKRAVLLRATPAGLELDEAVHSLRGERANDYFSTLDASDRAELARLLGLLLQAHPRPEGARGPWGRLPRPTEPTAPPA